MQKVIKNRLSWFLKYRKAISESLLSIHQRLVFRVPDVNNWIVSKRNFAAATHLR